MLATAAAIFLGAPAAAMSPVFGPRKFLRDTTGPEEVTVSFRNCEAGAAFRVRLENGERGARRVSSAVVALNGVEVVAPRDLNQNVADVTRAVTLLADNILSVRLAGAPGSFITISVECTSGCLSVAIAAPAANATLRGATVVRGTVASADDAGVTINGVAAATSDGRFAALVPLDEGTSTLQAIATNTCGHTASAAIPIRGLAPPNELLSGLAVAPAAGLAPLPVRLRVMPAFLAPVTNVTWDFDGDGSADAAGATLTDVDMLYDRAGIFTPAVSVRDASGVEVSAAAVVVVHDPSALAARLDTRWSAMVAALRGGRIDVALSLIDSSRRARFEPRLRGAAGAAAILDRPLERCEVRGPRAFCTAGELSVVFRIDEDGAWRIRFF